MATDIAVPHKGFRRIFFIEMTLCVCLPFQTGGWPLCCGASYWRSRQPSQKIQRYFIIFKKI